MSIFDLLKKAWTDADEHSSPPASVASTPSAPEPAGEPVSGALDQLKAEAAKLAAQQAAKQAAAAARAALEAAGEELLGDLEKQLSAGQQARQGRADVRPDAGEADAVAAQVLAEASRAEEAARALRQAGVGTGEEDPAQARRSAREERRRRAEEELARLKEKAGRQ